MAQFDDEAPPPGYRYVYFGDPAQGTSGRYPVAIETAPAETPDRPVAPHREAPGEVPGTGPTLDQMRLELSQQQAPSLPSLSEYLTNMPREVRDQFMALGETGMGVFGSMVAPVAAAATGVGKNIYDYLVNGQVTPQATNETANRAAQMFSYQPIMPSAQSILQLAGEAPAAIMGTSMGVPPVASGINYRALQAPRGTTGVLTAGVKRDLSQFDNDVFNAQRGVTPGYPTLGSEFSGAFVTPRPTVYDMLAGVEPSRIPSSASAAVKPEGNLNFTPNIKANILKGPDIQPVSSLLNQLANAQGLTASGLELGLERLRLLDPAMKMSKSAFVDQLKPSQYEKVNLLGKSDGNLEYYAEQALENMDPDEVLSRLGIPQNLASAALAFVFQDVDEPSPELEPFLRQNGWLDPDTFYDIFYDARGELAYEQAQNLIDEAGSVQDYSDIQRLVNPELTEDTYFEIGVKDPSYAGKYRHYSGAPEGTIGHIRGSFLDAPHELGTIPVREAGFYSYGADHPRAMLIEEIQSDANKGVKQTGPLHQIHGVLFKAAIQHALENGATTVYMPTSEPIAKVRDKPVSAYAPVYDQQIVKEGINPLKKIPGVTVAEGFDSDGKTKLMHRIDFTPEAVEYILKGEGQKLPGYAEGGAISLDQMRHELLLKAPKIDEVEEFNRFEAAGAPAYAKPLDMAGRATFLPFKDNLPDSVMNTREWAVPGILAEIYNAFTAPARSVTQLGFEAPEEALNTAMNVTGGSLGLSHAAPAPAGSLGAATKISPLPKYYHGSDAKGLTVLDPAASAGRRSEGSSVWVTPDETFAAGYPKKQTGSIYTTPLDTSGFAKIDANFTSNKAISPDAMIYHSSGDVTPVSSLGQKVTTDQLAAYARSKGDPGLRIMNVGDMGSGQFAGMGPNPSRHGESIAVFSPLKVSHERNITDFAKQHSTAEKIKPLTEKQFHNRYSQHVDMRNRETQQGAETLKSIQADGWKPGFSVNTLPPYRGGAPTNIVDKKLAPRAGDYVYLVPNTFTTATGNGLKINKGWTPKAHEAVRVTEDYPDMYKEYLKAFNSKAEGGVIHKAEGGAVTDTLDKMVKSPQASTLLNLDLPNLIAAKQQLRPMKQGGTVDFLNNIDDMRYALTRRQG